MSAPSMPSAPDSEHDSSNGLIHVVGVGLSGASSLSPKTLKIVESATILMGAQRQLEAFSYLWSDEVSPGVSQEVSQKRDQHSAPNIEAWPLGNFTQTFADLRSRLSQDPNTRAVVLASGDPLFFGIGRLLLASIPADQLIFYPQVSAIQLAFSRLKIPWQNATLISLHGRDEQQLVRSLKQGDRCIAILTDGVFTPSAIAQLITALDLPTRYRLWVCENLGSDQESLSAHWPHQLHSQPSSFAPLNVVVLQRQLDNASLEPNLLTPSRINAPANELANALPDATPEATPDGLPLIGLPDAAFVGFRDRPTLMTKREIRLLILGELAPLQGQTLWDIGAGTGSVSIELTRLCPTAQLYAIEKTAIGTALIHQNAQRLAHSPIQVIQGQAPAALIDLPKPDRVFIGGSSGQLVAILDFLHNRMTASSENALLNPRFMPVSANIRQASRRIVLALATLEHLSQVTQWIAQPAIAAQWHAQFTQINIARSLPVGPLTRFLPLTPITLVTLSARSETKER